MTRLTALRDRVTRAFDAGIAAWLAAADVSPCGCDDYTKPNPPTVTVRRELLDQWAKIGRGIIPWTVTRVTDHDIHLTANHVTSRTMSHHEALARLRVVA